MDLPVTENIEQYLEGYDARQVDTAATVLRTLRRKRISPDVFLQWAEARAETRRKGMAVLEQAGQERRRKGRQVREALRQHAPHCPDCQAQMGLYAGDNNDSHWVCRKCRHSIYRPHTPETELRRIGVKEI